MEGEADCTVITQASVCQNYAIVSSWPRLFAAANWKMQGDIQVVQNFGARRLAEFDPAELLAHTRVMCGGKYR